MSPRVICLAQQSVLHFYGIPLIGLVAIPLLFVLAVAGGIMFGIFKTSKDSSNEESSSNKQDSTHAEVKAEAKRRAIEIVSQQPAGSPACKCRKCGAIVDSTAELSAEGKVHCNYCNEWSSIL